MSDVSCQSCMNAPRGCVAAGCLSLLIKHTAPRRLNFLSILQNRQSDDEAHWELVWPTGIKAAERQRGMATILRTGAFLWIMHSFCGLGSTRMLCISRITLQQ